MTIESASAREAKIDADAVLAVLAEAMGQRRVPPHGRIAAAVSARSPEEGLALLAAYVSIEDVAVRQAILDAILTIAARP